jgi:hypothetical protein
MRRFVLAAALALTLVPAGQAAVKLGVVGSPYRMHNQTNQVSDVRLRFTGWGGGWRWGGQWQAFFFDHPTPVMSFGTHGHYGNEVITPRGIARGRGDNYLIAMNKAIAEYGKPVYIRPMAEMNNWRNFYCAFNQYGASRGRSHSKKSFKQGFRRLYTILHGGDVATLNARLAHLNLPKLRTSKTTLPELPVPTLKIVWNPMGFGSPDTRANRAQAYYPGNSYVDVVADDIYDMGGRYEYDAMVDLYKAHPDKPFALGEFGLWGLDDPGFIRAIGTFMDKHARTEFAVYYNSAPGSEFDLSDKSNSIKAYKQYVTPLGG